MKNLLIAILILCSHTGFSQQILLNTPNGKIYSWDPETCNLDFQFKIQTESVTDIALTPDNILYFTNNAGQLARVNDNGATFTVIYNFPDIGIVGLASDENGILFVAYSSGYIYRVDPMSPDPELIGILNSGLDGDMVIHQDILYITSNGLGFTSFDSLTQIGFQDIIPYPGDDALYTAVLYPGECFTPIIYSTARYDSEYLKFNLDSKEYDIVCDLNVTFWGGASTYEFYWKPIREMDIHTINPSCDSIDGKIIIDTSAFSEEYLYSLNGITYQYSPLFENLSFGTFTLFVKNKNDCIKKFIIHLIHEQAPLFEDVLVIQNHCGYNDGSITIHNSIDTVGLLYSINGENYSSNPSFLNLSEGTYLIHIKNSNGCIKNRSIHMEALQPEIHLVSIEKAVCDKPNGLAHFTHFNTINPKFSIDGYTYTSETSFDSLEAGMYTIYIEDGPNCIDSLLFEIESYTMPIITDIETTSTTCDEDNGSIQVINFDGISPLLFSVDSINFSLATEFTALPTGQIKVYIKDSLGCIQDKNEFIPVKPHPTLMPSTIPEHCEKNNGEIHSTTFGGENNTYSIDGINYQSSNKFSNLNKGLYTIYLIDQNQSSDTTEIYVDSFPAPQIVDIIIKDASCEIYNGSIEIKATDGFGKLQYSVSTITYFDTELFTNLRPGYFPITVKDELDCAVHLDVIIDEIPKPEIENIVSQNAFCGEEGSIEIQMKIPDNSYTYSLNNNDFDDSTIENLPIGKYEILVTDENNCSIVDTASIISESCDLYIPNVFTPGEDGINDVFIIQHDENWIGKVHEFVVYNRQGQIMYQIKDVLFEEIRWSGYFNGNILQQGVYVYFLEYDQDGQKQDIKKGDITIIR